VRATLKAGEIHTVPSTQRVVPRRKSLLLPHTVLPIGLLQRPGQIIILIKRPSTNKGWRPIRRSTCCCVKYFTHGRSMLCDKRLPLPQTGISQLSGRHVDRESDSCPECGARFITAPCRLCNGTGQSLLLFKCRGCRGTGQKMVCPNFLSHLRAQSRPQTSLPNHRDDSMTQ
jgi:hypothetical protein